MKWAVFIPRVFGYGGFILHIAETEGTKTRSSRERRGVAERIPVRPRVPVALHFHAG